MKQGNRDDDPGRGQTDQVKYSLGVLFVHGIGEQQRGDTLTEMGDALVKWLTRWCEPQGSVRILGTSLRVPDEGAPSTAHFDLRLMLPASGSNESVPHTWRLEESWWADTFRPSTFSQLAAWVLSIGSWVLATHFHGLHDRIRLPTTAPMPLRVLLWPVAVLTLAVLVTVALVLTVLVAILALGVLILRLVPIGPIQSLAGAAQRALAMGFGDLMVLVQSPTRFAAMTDRARRELRQLSRRCDAVVVIAHSQGSVVAWEAIRRPGRDDGKIPRTADDISPEETLVPANLVRFITFGQAMRKLELAYRVAASELNRGRGLLALLSVAAQLSLMFLVVAAVAVALGGDDIVGWATGWLPGAPHHLPAAALALIIGGYSMLLRASRIEQDAVADELREDVGRALHFSRNGVRIDRDRFGWIDLWASADPAPNGPLTNDPIERVESWRIRNGGSPITDHSTYWRNTTEFVGSVATELGRIGAGPPLFPPPASTFPSLRQALAGLTRAARIHVLVALRLIWIATAILGIFRLFPHVRAALDATRSWLPGDLPLIGPLGAWLPSLLAFAALAIAAFAIWTVLSTVWAFGVKADERSYFKDEVEGPFPWPAWLGVLLVPLVPIVTVVILLLTGAEAVVIWLYLLSLPPVVLVAAVFLSGGGRALGEPRREEARLPLMDLSGFTVTTTAIALAALLVGVWRRELEPILGWLWPIAYVAAVGALLVAAVQGWQAYLARHREVAGAYLRERDGPSRPEPLGRDRAGEIPAP